jgi:hypothetical protein
MCPLARESDDNQGSYLLLDEYYASQGDGFLNELAKVSSAKKLAGLAERWKADKRPWARGQMLAYVGRPMNRRGHNVLVKRLFKHAEQNGDTELMGAFVHAFDRSVRRERKEKFAWDAATRSAYSVEVLATPVDGLLPDKGWIEAKTGEKQSWYASERRSGTLFSYKTRYYLRRRALRYFRKMGFKSPEQYPAAMAGVLARYEDGDLAKGENILDSWCLLNVCFRHHEGLVFGATHVKLAQGRSLNELKPAPKFPEAWAGKGAGEVLWGLLGKARSRLVRVWAMEMLKKEHGAFLLELKVQAVLGLFEHEDDEVQQFAAEVLEKLPELPKMPLEMWMGLLKTRGPGALALVARLMLMHVSAERVDLKQAVGLACAGPTPIANLGLEYLKGRKVTQRQDLAVLSDLCGAQCDAVAGETTALALEVLGSKEHYDVVLVVRFFDAISKTVREASWGWLKSGSAGYDDAQLWSRLLETPYEDVRLRLVEMLQVRVDTPGTSLDKLAGVWSAVLLGIHRGGRHKIKALHQISRALAESPESAGKLLPVAATAIRSVRPAEARVGLAAVVQAVQRSPGLRAQAVALIPELKFISQGATA